MILRRCFSGSHPSYLQTRDTFINICIFQMSESLHTFQAQWFIVTDLWKLLDNVSTLFLQLRHAHWNALSERAILHSFSN